MRFILPFLLISYLSYSQDPQVNMLVEAESFLERKDTTGAVNVFRNILNRYPDSYPAALRLTEVYYLQGEYREAIQYSFVTEDILNRYIDSVRTTGEVSETDIARARRYERDLADIQMLKGKIRLKQNRPVDALHDLNQALRHSDRKSDVYIDIGLANISLGEYDAASKSFHSSLRLDPENKGALFNLGNLFYALKEYDSAQYYYKKTSEHYPDLKWPLLYLGNIATRDQQYDSAILYYSNFIAMDSTSEEAYFRRAVLYSEMRQWENAIEDWNRALALDEADSEALRNRGLAYFQRKEYDLALKDFNQSIALDPEPYSFINRGYTYYLLREYEKALSDLNHGLSELPDYGLGYYLRALTQRALKNTEKACADLQKALENGFEENDVQDRKLRKSCL